MTVVTDGLAAVSGRRTLSDEERKEAMRVDCFCVFEERWNESAHAELLVRLAGDRAGECGDLHGVFSKFIALSREDGWYPSRAVVRQTLKAFYALPQATIDGVLKGWVATPEFITGALARELAEHVDYPVPVVAVGSRGDAVSAAIEERYSDPFEKISVRITYGTSKAEAVHLLEGALRLLRDNWALLMRGEHATLALGSVDREGAC